MEECKNLFLITLALGFAACTDHYDQGVAKLAELTAPTKDDVDPVNPPVLGNQRLSPGKLIHPDSRICFCVKHKWVCMMHYMNRWLLDQDHDQKQPNSAASVPVSLLEFFSDAPALPAAKTVFDGFESNELLGEEKEAATNLTNLSAKPAFELPLPPPATTSVKASAVVAADESDDDNETVKSGHESDDESEAQSDNEYVPETDDESPSNAVSFGKRKGNSNGPAGKAQKLEEEEPQCEEHVQEAQDRSDVEEEDVKAAPAASIPKPVAQVVAANSEEKKQKVAHAPSSSPVKPVPKGEVIDVTDDSDEEQEEKKEEKKGEKKETKAKEPAHHSSDEEASGNEDDDAQSSIPVEQRKSPLL